MQTACAGCSSIGRAACCGRGWRARAPDRLRGRHVLAGSRSGSAARCAVGALVPGAGDQRQAAFGAQRLRRLPVGRARHAVLGVGHHQRRARRRGLRRAGASRAARASPLPIGRDDERPVQGGVHGVERHQVGVAGAVAGGALERVRRDRQNHRRVVAGVSVTSGSVSGRGAPPCVRRIANGSRCEALQAAADPLARVRRQRPVALPDPRRRQRGVDDRRGGKRARQRRPLAVRAAVEVLRRRSGPRRARRASSTSGGRRTTRAQRRAPRRRVRRAGWGGACPCARGRRTCGRATAAPGAGAGGQNIEFSHTISCS